MTPLDRDQAIETNFLTLILTLFALLSLGADAQARSVALGMFVADGCAGTGTISLSFAEKVGAGGTAIAQDSAPELFLRENYFLEVLLLCQIHPHADASSMRACF